MPSYDTDMPGEGKMPFPVMAAVGLGTQLIGSIFGGLSAAKKERDALKRERTRKPFQLSKGTSSAMRTGYDPNGTGQNIYSLFPLMSPRMMAVMGSRYSSGVYDPKRTAADYGKPTPMQMQGAPRTPADSGKDGVYRELAEMRRRQQ